MDFILKEHINGHSHLRKRETLPTAADLPPAFYCEMTRGRSIRDDQSALILKDARTPRRESNLFIVRSVNILRDTSILLMRDGIPWLDSPCLGTW